MALGFLAAIPLYPLLAPGRGVPAVRAVLRARAVDHGIPGARPHPRRAAHAQGARRRARAGSGVRRRRHGLAPARGGLGGRRRPAARSGEVLRRARADGLLRRLHVRPSCRRILSQVSTAFDEAGHVPAAWLTAIFVGVLGSSFLAQRIGVATIFGAFVFGVVMPRRADLNGEVTERLESFVVHGAPAALLRRQRPQGRRRGARLGRALARRRSASS